MKEYFRDPYGCTASIKGPTGGRWTLRLCLPDGSCFHAKTYSTYRGARIALGKKSEGMMESVRKES